jgi:secreted trypsin-like serine protease
MKRIVGSFVGIFALLAVLSVGNSTVRAVTYGEPVVDAAATFPEVISVWAVESPGFLNRVCTAVLVEQQIAVTAAHCVQPFRLGLFVEVGATKLGEGRSIPVQVSWYSPRYSSSRFANDVAVLYLSSPANVSGLAQIKKKTIFSPASKLSIAGWGVDQNGDNLPQLQKLIVKYDTGRAAQIFGSRFNKKANVAAGRWFAEEKLYGGACNGDSGGPLFLGPKKGRRNLVGIISFGVSGCDRNAPTVFTRVDYYFSQISTAIEFVKQEAKRIQVAIEASPIKVNTTFQQHYYSQTSWDFGVSATMTPGANVIRWCFFVDGRRATDAEMPYDAFPFTHRRNGCLYADQQINYKAGTMFFHFENLASGEHSVLVEITDSLGQVFTSPVTKFVR